MKINKHKRFLKNGSNSIKIGEKVSPTDVNLAYFYTKDLNPNENISITNIKKDYKHTAFSRNEKGSEHFNRPSVPNANEAPKLPSKEETFIEENYTPMWPNENGILYFADINTITYPNQDGVIYKEYAPNIDPGGFTLTNDFMKDNNEPLFYSYTLKHFVYDKHVNITEKIGSIKDVTNITSISLLDENKNVIQEKKHKILYEKIATNIYRVNIMVSSPNPYIIKYISASKAGASYTPSNDYIEETYVHYPVFTQTSSTPQNKKEFQIITPGISKQLKVAEKGVEIKDRSLHIKWSVFKTHDEKLLQTPWHYDTTGQEYKDVSHETIQTVFQRYFSGISTSNLNVKVESVNSSVAPDYKLSNNKLMVKSSGSHIDIFPIAKTAESNTEELNIPWKISAKAKKDVVRQNTSNRWSLHKNNYEVSVINESSATKNDNGLVQSINNPNNFLKVNENSRRIDFVNSDSSEYKLITHIYMPIYTAISLRIEVNKDSNNFLKIEKATRESIAYEYTDPELYFSKKDVELVEQYIALSPGWNKLIITSNSKNLIILETIGSQLNSMMNNYEWQMASSIATGSNWQESLSGNTLIKTGQTKQIVPNNFNSVITNEYLTEFEWIDLSSNTNNNIILEKESNFKTKGTFNLTLLGNQNASISTNDILSKARTSSLKIESMIYKSYEDIEINVEGTFKSLVRNKPPSKIHSSLVNKGFDGDGLFRNYFDIIKTFFFWASPSQEDARDYSHDYYDYNETSGTAIMLAENRKSIFGSKIRAVNLKSYIYVSKDISVPWSLRVTDPRFSSGNQAKIKIYLEYDSTKHFVANASGYTSFTMNLKQGWNKIVINVEMPKKIFHIWFKAYTLSLRFNNPLWKALENAGLQTADYVINSKGSQGYSQISKSLHYSKKARVKYDPEENFVLDFNPSMLGDISGASDLTISTPYLSDNKNGRVSVITEDLPDNNKKITVKQIDAEIISQGSRVIPISIKENAITDKWFYPTTLSGDRIDLLSLSSFVENETDSDLIDNQFIKITPANESDLLNLRVGTNNNYYSWSKRKQVDPASVLFYHELNSDKLIECSSHLHSLISTPKYALQKGEYNFNEDDSSFGDIKISDNENHEQNDSINNQDKNINQKIQPNWYLTIHAKGNETKFINSINEELDNPPIHHPIFNLYPSLIDFQDSKLELSYSIPEYEYQNLFEDNGNQGKLKMVTNETPIILDNQTIQTRNKNIWIPNSPNIKPEHVIFIDNHIIDTVDLATNTIKLKTRISDSEEIKISYRYITDKYEFRGSTIGNKLLHLDLNPGPYHTFSEVSGFIPGHLYQNIDDIVEVDGNHLINKDILIYLKPTLIKHQGEIIYESNYGVYHTDLTIKEMMKYDPLIMPIAIINIVPNSSLRDLVLIDTRSQGGGLLEEITNEIIKKSNSEADSYWDIGFYDGQSYQGNAVNLIRIPKSLLKSNGGNFTKEEIEIIVNKHVALGVLPIVEFV